MPDIDSLSEEEFQVYERVVFHFRADRCEETTEVGKVIIRPGQMVLNVPNGSEPDYVIIGKASEFGFAGERELPADAYWDYEAVVATWTAVGERYEGKWVQDGDDEYDFWFRRVE